MEETNKYVVLENGEKFSLLKMDSFGKQTIFCLAKTFRINPKTRKIHKIYKSNHELGIKLFKMYLDMNPQEIITNQNIDELNKEDTSKPTLIDFLDAAPTYTMTKFSLEELSILIKEIWSDKEE